MNRRTRPDERRRRLAKPRSETLRVLDANDLRCVLGAGHDHVVQGRPKYARCETRFCLP